MLCPTRKRPRSGPWASSVTARARPPKSKKVSSRFDTRDGYRFSREVNIVSPLLRGGAKTLPRPRGDPVKVFKASGSHRRWPACLDAEGKPWVAFSRRGHSAPGRLGLGRVAHPSGHTERGSGDRSLRLVKRASRGCKPARRARARRSDGPSRRSLAIRPRDSKATPGGATSQTQARAAQPGPPGGAGQPTNIFTPGERAIRPDPHCPSAQRYCASTQSTRFLTLAASLVPIALCSSSLPSSSLTLLVLPR